jgi:hypothetical protein
MAERETFDRCGMYLIHSQNERHLYCSTTMHG